MTLLRSATIGAVALIALTATSEARPKHRILDANGNRGYCLKSGGSVAVEPLVPELRSKVQEIVAACGSVVISTGYRGGATPNHREWKAADLTRNSTCIYAHLKEWPGGYSTDYGTVEPHHVHISYNKAHEWGVRFAHSQEEGHTMSAKRRGNTKVASAPSSYYSGPGSSTFH